MKKFAIFAALAAATALSAPAHAGSADGKWQVKVLGTAVLPDGKVTGLPTKNLTVVPSASIDTKANDNYVPTLAVEYFATPNVSIETICCFTQHHVSGAGGIAGTDIVQHVLILPATVTVKLHLDAGAIKPYIGAGVTDFFVFGEKPGATAIALGASSVKMSNAFGGVLQAGVDVPLGKDGLGLSLDAKRYFVRPTAHFYSAAGAEVLTTEHQLDPWVLSAGVSYRF